MKTRTGGRAVDRLIYIENFNYITQPYKSEDIVKHNVSLQ